MRMVLATKETITNLRIRLTLDYICWISSTAVLLFYGFPTIAALFGATGILYLWHATKRFSALRRNILHWIEQKRLLEEFLKHDDHPNP